MVSTKKSWWTPKMAESRGNVPAPITVTSNGRRYYSEAIKRSVVEQCLVPGASVAGVSLAHGFNANLVRKWIRMHQRGQLVRQSDARMLPVRMDKAALSKPSVASAAGARAAGDAGVIELEVGGIRLILRGEVDRNRILSVLEILTRFR